MKTICAGEVFYGRHADLLNELGFVTKQGKAFENYYKGTFPIDDDTYIWIISIDGNERGGWINEYLDNDTIVERNIDNKEHQIGLTHKYRLVFDKKKTNTGNIYTFKGFFELQQGSTNVKRTLKKIKDNLNLNILI